jgi:hypothetical protein
MKSPPAREVAEDLRVVNMHVEGLTPVYLHVFGDGRNDWKMRVNKPSPGALFSEDTVPGVVRSEVVKFDANATAKRLLAKLTLAADERARRG